MAFFLETDRTGLRPLATEDATGEYLGWLNDHEVTRGLETGIFPSTKESLVDFVKRMGSSKDNLIFAIIDRQSGKHIGNIKLGNINWVHRNGELGILIGDKSSWGKGHGTDACRLLVQYAFEKLNLHKVWLAVFSNNPAAISIYKKLGFTEEGRLKEHVFSEGKFVDKILMSVFNNAEK
ncbi:MAG TPA: GNAT family protein [Bacteroidia bacterium]|nr:GNAT family protein [Bacteroidia bacterium]